VIFAWFMALIVVLVVLLAIQILTMVETLLRGDL